ncbi:MAG: nucleotide-binding protein, partial [Methylococcaceae bacterium]|nr:nucleotide-binding protein [Methylococcaceae bacterium]
DEEKRTVRDNVIFELGLFIGTIGKERCFILKPRNETLHFPTDLLGMTFADYDANRSDGDITSAVNAPCTQIKQQMKKLKQISNVENFSAPKSTPAVIKELSDYDFKVLFELLGTRTESPNGYALCQIKNALNDYSRQIDLSVVKLENLKYVDKKNGLFSNSYNNNYEEELFFYTLTEGGLNFLLENEGKVFKPNNEAKNSTTTINDPMLDDIPF